MSGAQEQRDRWNKNNFKQRERLLEYWRKVNKDPKRKKRKREAERKLKFSKRWGVLAYYGDGELACVQCGFSDERSLTIDHIKNDGAEHRRKFRMRGGSTFYHWLIKNKLPDGFQTLCANCQMIKERLRREAN